MYPRIVVTGMGIITSIGNGLGETFESLRNRRSGIGPISILDTIHKKDLMAGEVKLTYDELLDLAKVNPEQPWTRTTLLGLIAARQAIEDADIKAESANETGLVSATTVGGMDRSELYYKSFLANDTPNPFIDTHHAGDHTEKIAAELGIKGYLTTISTACSSSLNSIMFGARLIKNGVVDRVVVGGTDALSKFTLNGFNTLMILDKEQCRPFDASRMGLNLGEGAAYLVLEKEEDAISKGKKMYAEVAGFANANDAFHQTASSDSGVGPFLAMNKAMKIGGISPEQVDYINVHGTGTDNNDLTEGKAMLRLFEDKLPPFSSTKAYTGHTLGAAGAVESIISILSLNHNLMFPNLNFRHPIEELNIEPLTEVEPKELTTVLTNSFGFGGNDSSLIFSKVDETKGLRPKTLDLRPGTLDLRPEKQVKGSESQEPGASTSGQSWQSAVGSEQSPVSSRQSANSELQTPNSEPLTQHSTLTTQNSKLHPPILINGIGSVSPQETLADGFLDNISEFEEPFLQIAKPNFRDFIDPKLLRRMSKIVKMSLVAARIAQEDAGSAEVDAIITGTGMGCQIDTEKFLNSMLENGETLLNPTSFIQSTHNTMGAQVALMSGNNNYNLTYVHRTFSFETALLDSMMLINEGKAGHVLLGGIDEITEESWLIKTRLGYFKREATSNLKLLEDEKQGALAGESASFFSLSSQKNEGSYASVSGVDTFFSPANQEEIHSRIHDFLMKRKLDVSSINLVILGYNGDKRFDEIYKKVETELFKEQTIAYYKHLCGEHDASSAFAFWTASRILKSQTVPETLIKRNGNGDKIERVLIYNQFRNVNHSLILLEKA